MNNPVRNLRNPAELLDDLLDEEVTLEDLPESYRRIANLIGPEKAICLAAELGGSLLYIPKFEAVIRNIRDRKIKHEFDGSNYHELARKYGLSEAWVRDILREGSPAKPKQTRLF